MRAQHVRAIKPSQSAVAPHAIPARMCTHATRNMTLSLMPLMVSLAARCALPASPVQRSMLRYIRSAAEGASCWYSCIPATWPTRTPPDAQERLLRDELAANALRSARAPRLQPSVLRAHLSVRVHACVRRRCRWSLRQSPPGGLNPGDCKISDLKPSRCARDRRSNARSPLASRPTYTLSEAS